MKISPFLKIRKINENEYTSKLNIHISSLSCFSQLTLVPYISKIFWTLEIYCHLHTGVYEAPPNFQNANIRARAPDIQAVKGLKCVPVRLWSLSSKKDSSTISSQCNNIFFKRCLTMSPFKDIWAALPTWYQCLWYVIKPSSEMLYFKIKHLSVHQKIKTYNWQVSSYLFYPI